MISLNGRIMEEHQVHISPLTMGAAYGYGLFETILITRQRPVFWQDHIYRLLNSAQVLDIPVPHEKLILEWLLALLEAKKVQEGRAKVTLYAGNESKEREISTSMLMISGDCRVLYPENIYQQGLSVGLLSFPKNHNSPVVMHKTCNYLENILGMREACRKGWSEGLFLNGEGNLAEGTKSNVFLVKDKQIFTPDTSSGLLPGITRSKILDIAKAKSLILHERKVSPQELLGIEECFISNSLMGVMPVTLINNNPVGGGKPGEITKILREGYLKLINENKNLFRGFNVL